MAPIMFAVFESFHSFFHFLTLRIVCHLAMVEFFNTFWPTATAAAAQDETRNNNKRFTAACLPASDLTLG